MTEHDPRLQPGECGSETEVRAFAEGHVTLPAGTVQPELVGIFEVRGVTIGRSPQQQQARTRVEVHTAQCGVADDVSLIAPEGGLVAQYFLEESAD